MKLDYKANLALPIDCIEVVVQPLHWTYYVSYIETCLAWKLQGTFPVGQSGLIVMEGKRKLLAACQLK